MPRDLHDAPVLYIAGNRPLHFSAAGQRKLREFIEEGGLIVGNADCGNDGFKSSFEKLGRDLFPGYDFRELPSTHPIFVNEQFHAVDWKLKLKVLGLSNGVRELMLLPNVDLSRAFQTRIEPRRAGLFELADNIVLYSVDQTSFREKGVTYLVEPDTSIIAQRQLRVGRLRYAGNWDPEPGGWPRLAAMVHNTDRVDLVIQSVTPDPEKLVATETAPATGPSAQDIRKQAVKRITPAEMEATGGDSGKLDDLIKLKAGQVQAELDAASRKRQGNGRLFDVVHITGTTSFKLTDTQRLELHKFVEAGGLLIIDAAGGSEEFASASTGELKAIFGADAAQLEKPLSAENALFSADGQSMNVFHYRRFAQAKLGHLAGPELRGITLGGRLAVIESRQDLSGGLVGQAVDGIVGYSPETSCELMRKALLSFSGK